MEGLTYIGQFLPDAEIVFQYLKNNVAWDERMAARRTASFGVAYNYSQMTYPFQPMPVELQELCKAVERVTGFEPNNCLINYYLDGSSKMGFHSDQTDILEENTGIGIISLGQARILRFRNIHEKAHIQDFLLQSGSLLYMTQQVQNEWEHAVPKSTVDAGRMSITLRRIK